MLKVEISNKNHSFLDATLHATREDTKTSEPKRKPLVQSSPLRSAFAEKDVDKALQIKER